MIQSVDNSVPLLDIQQYVLATAIDNTNKHTVLGFSVTQRHSIVSTFRVHLYTYE